MLLAEEKMEDDAQRDALRRLARSGVDENGDFLRLRTAARRPVAGDPIDLAMRGLARQAGQAGGACAASSLIARGISRN